MKGKILFTSLMAVFSWQAGAYAAVPGYELVYTTPVETSLVNPDLRSPVDVWAEMFGNAKKTIDLEHMYAVGKPGEPLEKVIAALEAAGQRGVKIRMMLEQKMLRASEAATIERLKKIKGMEFQMIEFGKVIGRDAIVHAKFFIVDGKRAYMGSQNFDWRSLKHIQELGVKIEDVKVAKQMQAIFDQDWKAAKLAASGKKIAPTSSLLAGLKNTLQNKNPPAATLVASPGDHLPKGIGASEWELSNLLSSAKQEIRIQVMNYAPFDRQKNYYGLMDDGIRAAALKGVKVKLMVADWSTEKPAIDFLKSLSLVPNVEVRIVTIPQAKEGHIPFARVVHSKFMSVDGSIGWVGTSNWEGGYLNHLRNLELVFRDKDMAQRLAALHTQLWDSGYALPVDVNKDYPKVKKGE